MCFYFNMTPPWLHHLAYAVILITCTPVHCLKTYYMDQNCGTRGVMLDSGAILLEFTAAFTYPPDTECLTTVGTWEQNMDGLLVRVLSIDVPASGFHCDYGGRLIMYDGGTVFSRRLTSSYGICGQVAPSTVYTATSGFVTLNFSSDFNADEGKGFQLLITGFDSSEACNPSTEYECDDLLCVDRDLKCDGYYNCRDKSDEGHCHLTAGEIVGISLGGVVAVVFLGFVVVIFAVNRRRASLLKATKPPTENSPITEHQQPQPTNST